MKLLILTASIRKKKRNQKAETSNGLGFRRFSVVMQVYISLSFL